MNNKSMMLRFLTAIVIMTLSFSLYAAEVEPSNSETKDVKVEPPINEAELEPAIKKIARRTRHTDERKGGKKDCCRQFY